MKMNFEFGLKESKLKRRSFQIGALIATSMTVSFQFLFSTRWRWGTLTSFWGFLCLHSFLFRVVTFDLEVHDGTKNNSGLVHFFLVKICLHPQDFIKHHNVSSKLPLLLRCRESSFATKVYEQRKQPYSRKISFLGSVCFLFFSEMMKCWNFIFKR